MEREVKINDPAIDILIDAVSTLASHIENLYDMSKRHRHFALDDDNPDGGVWTKLNDSIRDVDLDDARYALRDLRDELKGIRQPS